MSHPRLNTGMSRFRLNGARDNKVRVNNNSSCIKEADLSRIRLNEEGLSRIRVNQDQEKMLRPKDIRISRLRLNRKRQGDESAIEADGCWP